ncbi:hypothetical protein ACFQFC_31635 [Amorphoplanes digitatis]|uniref:Uncharacterized protein n=1 Tax=Actinoplanes digitatis TaxID=1868 RepID=A0A7W7HU08_9ACTN|nr:hypothetical protein [Actinoplanes digitatis]MBB4760709.1 hypothetical protein [Actinoplanes digitatis]GID94269.1 hypothetical protein Adi01nite_36810 [Actinoplanes digitatis]
METPSDRGDRGDRLNHIKAVKGAPAMPLRNERWIWAGRGAFGVIVIALAAYLATTGLDKADKIAGSIGAVLALAALCAPYLLPRPGEASTSETNRVEGSGDATAVRGGAANTGVQITGGGPAHVTRSGNAHAEGRGSIANTGVWRGADR